MPQNSQDDSYLPPQSVEMETALLGAVLVDEEAMPQIADMLKPGDFYENKHQLIFEAMLELYEKRRPIDVVTVTEVLKEKNNLEEIGGASYLTNLAKEVPSSAHVESYAETIGSKATLRRLTSAGSRISKLAVQKSGEHSVDEILDHAEQTLFSVTQKHLKSAFTPLGDVLADAFDRIDTLHENRGDLRGLPTGFEELDDLLAGLQRGDLIIVAARPSMGKTSFALNIALNASVKAGNSVGIFSLEMSKDQLVDRLLSAQAGVDAWRLRTGKLRDEDFTQLSRAMNELSEAPLYIDDTAFMNVMEVRTKARRLKADKGLDMLIVDHIQLMEGRNNTESRVQEMAEISRSLKALSKELEIPVIAVSQLSRRVERRPSKKPQLADLRASGSIEQDADVVMLMYREDYYEDEPDRPNITEIDIAKHRNGPPGHIELYFKSEQMVFRPLAKNRETKEES